MEVVAMLRVLWRYRLLVVVAALLAAFVGLSVAYRIGFPPKLQSRQYQVGVGSVTALVDTPSSQIVDLGPDTGADIATLAARASLLASLMTSSPIKDEIASRAGVAPDQLIAVSPAGPPGASASAGPQGAPQNLTDPKAIILTAKIPNLESGDVPIIAVTTQAPDAAAAGRLANESIAVLQAHLKTVAGIDRVPDARRVVVRQLGQARSTTVARGPAKVMAIVAGFVVFIFGCVAILGVFALVSGWRRAAELEPLPGAASDEEGEASSDDGWLHAPRELTRPLHDDEVARDPQPARGDAAQGDVFGFRGARGS
jgi:hypothetical protein